MFKAEASKKGVSATISGFIFCIYSFVMMVSSPIFGKLLPKLGQKFLMLAGIFLAGSCNILFGVLDRTSGVNNFVVLCFAVRSMMALGAGNLNN